MWFCFLKGTLWAPNTTSPVVTSLLSKRKRLARWDREFSSPPWLASIQVRNSPVISCQRVKTVHTYSTEACFFFSVTLYSISILLLNVSLSKLIQAFFSYFFTVVNLSSNSSPDHKKEKTKSAKLKPVSNSSLSETNEGTHFVDSSGV